MKHRRIKNNQLLRLPLYWLVHGFLLPFVQVRSIDFISHLFCSFFFASKRFLSIFLIGFFFSHSIGMACFVCYVLIVQNNERRRTSKCHVWRLKGIMMVMVTAIYGNSDEIQSTSHWTPWQHQTSWLRFFVYWKRQKLFDMKNVFALFLGWVDSWQQWNLPKNRLLNPKKNQFSFSILQIF